MCCASCLGPTTPRPARPQQTAPSPPGVQRPPPPLPRSPGTLIKLGSLRGQGSSSQDRLGHMATLPGPALPNSLQLGGGGPQEGGHQGPCTAPCWRGTARRKIRNRLLTLSHAGIRMIVTLFFFPCNVTACCSLWTRGTRGGSLCSFPFNSLPVVLRPPGCTTHGQR